MSVATDIIRARLFLMHATEPPAPSVSMYAMVHGPVEAVERIQAGAAPASVLAEIAWPDPDLGDDLAALEAGIAWLITPEDENWPRSAAHDLAMTGMGAPLGLWLRGTATAATEWTEYRS
ncbi:hypothetical protein [Amycolatopsis sp. NPDC059021]|uniref:hypothetical protein n=1 Tax=Amycolatopsis sp. NPDC059021 TaxID=3346704 RepID=UPI00366B2257